MIRVLSETFAQQRIDRNSEFLLRCLDRRCPDRQRKKRIHNECVLTEQHFVPRAGVCPRQKGQHFVRSRATHYPVRIQPVPRADRLSQFY